MILYTAKNGVYYNLEDFRQDLSDLGENGFTNKIYINMTNRCSCACTFCLRSLKEFNEHNSLWLRRADGGRSQGRIYEIRLVPCGGDHFLRIRGADHAS